MDMVSLLRDMCSDRDRGKEIIDEWLKNIRGDEDEKRIRKVSEDVKKAFECHCEKFPNEIVTTDLLERFHDMASGIVVR